jgi:hypothetical protein
VVHRVAVVALVLLLASAACGGGGGSTKAFCDSVRSGDNPLDVFDRYDPTAVAASKDLLQRGRDRLHELEQAAPDEIRSSIHVLVGFADQLIATLDPATKPKSTPDFTSQFPQVQDASAKVTAFAKDKCGVDLQTPTTAPAATLPSS